MAGIDGAIEWRHLDPTLWVAIGPHGHLGTIEQGRRYVAIDTRGEIRGRCRTLEHAMAVLVAVGDHTRRQHAASAQAFADGEHTGSVPGSGRLAG